VVREEGGDVEVGCCWKKRRKLREKEEGRRLREERLSRERERERERERGGRAHEDEN
jgi:hypothetical protein